MKPKVVCLCGSTKFKKEFEDANMIESLNGNIVLSVGCFNHSDNLNLGEKQKQELDNLHKRKIDLADEIFVLNVNGYIGDSTRDEIKYAKEYGKEIRYLEDTDWQNKDFELDELVEITDDERKEIEKGMRVNFSENKCKERISKILNKCFDDLYKQREKSVEIITILLNKLSEISQKEYENLKYKKRNKEENTIFYDYMLNTPSWASFFDFDVRRIICDYINESITHSTPSYDLF